MEIFYEYVDIGQFVSRQSMFGLWILWPLCVVCNVHNVHNKISLEVSSRCVNSMASIGSVKHKVANIMFYLFSFKSSRNPDNKCFLVIPPNFLEMPYFEASSNDNKVA